MRTYTYHTIHKKTLFISGSNHRRHGSMQISRYIFRCQHIKKTYHIIRNMNFCPLIWTRIDSQRERQLSSQKIQHRIIRDKMMLRIFTLYFKFIFRKKTTQIFFMQANMIRVCRYRNSHSTKNNKKKLTNIQR